MVTEIARTKNRPLPIAHVVDIVGAESESSSSSAVGAEASIEDEVQGQVVKAGLGRPGGGSRGVGRRE